MVNLSCETAYRKRIPIRLELEKNVDDLKTQVHQLIKIKADIMSP